MDYTLYFIPGVATDRRVFSRLTLSHYHQVYLDWVPPLGHEDLHGYATRLAEQIDPSSQAILIGYSFGGMVAIEMAKRVTPAAVILVSSIKSWREQPLGMLVTSLLRLNRLLPSRLGKELRWAYTWMNDPQSEEEQAFIREMAGALDTQHTDWAIEQALRWRHEGAIPQLYHIQGDRDRIFPICYIDT